MSTEITLPAENQLAVSDPESILRFAIERGAGVDVMERLLALHEKMKASAAKEAFDRALANFQSECPIITKTKMGPKQAYKYAPLDEIVYQTRELLRKHGFSFSVSSDIDTGWVKAVCKVTHCMGHSELSEFKAPIDSKNPMMSDPQRYGGAMTFAKRYAFCNAFGILTADEDRDANDRREAPYMGPQKPEEQPLDRPSATAPPAARQTSAPATPAASTPGATATAPPKQTPAMIDLRKRLAAKAKGPFQLPDDPRSDEYRTKWESFTDYLMQNEIITRELKTLSEDELRAVVETVEATTDEELSTRF